MALLEEGEPTLDSALKALRRMKYDGVSSPQDVPELLARLQSAVYAQGKATTTVGGGLSGRARFLVGAGAGEQLEEAGGARTTSRGKSTAPAVQAADV